MLLLVCGLSGGSVGACVVALCRLCRCLLCWFALRACGVVFFTRRDYVVLLGGATI